MGDEGDDSDWDDWDDEEEDETAGLVLLPEVAFMIASDRPVCPLSLSPLRLAPIVIALLQARLASDTLPVFLLLRLNASLRSIV